MRLILLGPPGAGREAGDAAGREVWYTSALHRRYVARGRKGGNAIGLQAKAVMDLGALVSDDIVVGIIRDRIERARRQEWVHSRWISAHGRSGRGARRMLANKGLSSTLRSN